MLPRLATLDDSSGLSRSYSPDVGQQSWLSIYEIDNLPHQMQMSGPSDRIFAAFLA